MNKLTVFIFGCVLVASAALSQVYNLFQPGGDLAGAGSTWNSQIIANNAITTAKINTAAVDLTTKVTGLLPVGNGGIGVGTLTGLALGNGASAFTAYAGTSCTNQFPRSLSASGVATCATVANADLANSAITINGTSTALGGTRTLTLASADFVNQGTTTTLLHGNAAGNPSFAAVANADLANSSITINGTSTALGGTRTLTLASADYVNQGTTTTVLHGNAAGNPSFAAVSLTADVSGVLPLANGGNGTATPTANPTGLIGMSAINGSATTYERTDATHAIDPAISPTWTGNHTFSAASGASITANGSPTGSAAAAPIVITGYSVGSFSYGLQNHAGTNSADSSALFTNQANTQNYLSVVGDGGVVVGSPTGSDKGLGTVNAVGVYSNGTQLLAILSGTTGSIGGGALLAGQCSSGTVSITGATTSMVALADPNTYPGDGTIWDGQVTSAGTVTVKVCAIVALSPSASTYNVRVIP